MTGRQRQMLRFQVWSCEGSHVLACLILSIECHCRSRHVCSRLQSSIIRLTKSRWNHRWSRCSCIQLLTGVTALHRLVVLWRSRNSHHASTSQVLLYGISLISHQGRQARGSMKWQMRKLQLGERLSSSRALKRESSNFQSLRTCHTKRALHHYY